MTIYPASTDSGLNHAQLAHRFWTAKNGEPVTEQDWDEIARVLAEQV